MSFVPAPQQANAAGSNNAPSNNQVTTSTAAAAATETSDMEAVFKIRTFDVYWVDKTALMYRDGIDKVCIPVLNISRACLVWAHHSVPGCCVEFNENHLPVPDRAGQFYDHALR